MTFFPDELDGEIEDASSRLEKGLDFGCDASNGVGDRGVPTPTVDSTPGIDADDVTLLKFSRSRNAVHHFFVDGDA